MHSSQNEQDSRYLAEFAKIPAFEPSNQQEAYDLTLEAFDLSEHLKLPVMIRIVTRLAHSRANVRALNPEQLDELNEVPKPRPDSRDWVLIPANARRRYRHLLEMQSELLELSEGSSHNVLKLAGKRGIIASGIAYNYVREALGDDVAGDSLLKVSAYPIPTKLVRELVEHCDDILVVEDGYPYIETRLKGLLGVPGKSIHGRTNGFLPPSGELTPDVVAAAFGQKIRSTFRMPDDLPGRPPSLCRGCPHIDTFKAIIDATADHPNSILFSDIGCYTLGCLPPYEAVHSCVDMGASIAMAHGASQAGAFPVLCTIGDSTFTHSGMTPLIGAARADADMTVLVLDNATVGMTGGQDTLACGEDLIELIRGLGVNDEHLHVIEPLAKNHAAFTDLIRREINHRGLSVIVPRRACIHVKKPLPAKKSEQPEAVAVSGT